MQIHLLSDISYQTYLRLKTCYYMIIKEKEENGPQAEAPSR